VGVVVRCCDASAYSTSCFHVNCELSAIGNDTLVLVNAHTNAAATLFVASLYLQFMPMDCSVSLLLMLMPRLASSSITPYSSGHSCIRNDNRPYACWSFLMHEHTNDAIPSFYNSHTHTCLVSLPMSLSPTILSLLLFLLFICPQTHAHICM
jgi:hypothetical protein